MEEANLLSDGNCFVEMGAGRGHVNHWIQRALGDETDAQFILVDKQGVRYKMDSQHRDDSDGRKSVLIYVALPFRASVKFSRFKVYFLSLGLSLVSFTLHDAQ